MRCLPHFCRLEDIVQGGERPTTIGFSFSRRCQRRRCCSACSRSQPLAESNECVSKGSTCLRAGMTRSGLKTSKKTCRLDVVRMRLAFRSSRRRVRWFKPRRVSTDAASSTSVKQVHLPEQRVEVRGRCRALADALGKGMWMIGMSRLGASHGDFALA